MTEAVNALLGAKLTIAVGWLALFLVLERWRPAAVPPVAVAAEGPRRVVRNITFWAVNGAASLLVVVPLTQAAAGLAPGWRPPWWAGWPGLVLDLLLLDLWIYWWHRANHRLPPLWRFHEVHHLDRFLDASTAVRFHVGEVLLSALVRAAVIIALAVPLTSVLVFELLLLLASVFHHSNVRLPPAAESALSRIVVTPSIHWVHHHAVRRDTDSNYATVLSVWDRLFASVSPQRRTPQMAIGVEGRGEEPLPLLLVRPFRPAP
jgi:sterol desaturase/sphingolipid hydroxylase (fatty acid hydroxylase superfamily)